MKNFKSKVANFFYYYKWHTLIVLFFVVILSVLIFQMCSKEKYDIRVMYAGPAIISDEINSAVTDSFRQIGVDYDKNGEVTAEFFDLIIMNEEELNEAYESGQNPYFLNEGVISENRETFTFHSMANEYALVFVSPDCYKTLKDNGYVVLLDTMGLAPEEEGAEGPDIRYDDGAVYLHRLDFAEFFSVYSVFPEDTLVCIKRVKTTDKGNSDAEINQKNHIDLFKRIIEFTLPADYVPPETA